VARRRRRCTVTTKIALDEARFLSTLESRYASSAEPVRSLVRDGARLGEQDGLNPNSVGLCLLRHPC
jgi:hypothetical protein